MKIMFHYAWKTLFRRKKLVIVAVISLILSSLLICCATTMTDALFRSINEYSVSKFGEYTAIIDVSNADDYSGDATIYKLGKITEPQSLYDGQISYGCMSDNAIEMLGVTVKEGSFPQKDNEIALDYRISQMLDLTFEIGDEFGGFVISGIINIPDGLLEHREDNGAFLIPMVLFHESRLGHDNIESVLTVSCDSVDTINKQYIGAVFNQRFNEEGLVERVDGSTKAILLILFISAILCSLVLIYAYNSFSNALMKEHFIQLHLLGAGKGDLLSFSLFQSGIVFLLSILPSTTLGLGFGAVASKRIVEQFLEGYRFQVSIPAVALSILIPLTIVLISRLISWFFFSYMGLRAVEQEVFTIKRKMKNQYAKWVLAQTKKNHRSLVAIAYGLVLCFAIAFLGSMFVSAIEAEYGKIHNDDYVVSLFDGGAFTTFDIQMYPNYGISDSVVNELNSDEYSNIQYMKRLSVVTEVEKALSKQMDQRSVEDIFKGDAALPLDTKNLGLNEELEHYVNELYEVSDGLLNRMLESEANNAELFGDGKTIAIVARMGTPYKVGDKINLNWYIPKETSRFSSENVEKYTAEVTIGAVLKLENDYFNDKLRGNKIRFVCKTGFLETYGLEISPNYLYIETENHEHVETVLKNLKSAEQGVKVVSKYDLEKEMRALIDGVTTCAVSIILFSFGICTLALVNLTKARYIESKRLFGVLRCLGLQKQTVLMYHIAEVFALASVAVMQASFLIAVFKIISRQGLAPFPTILTTMYILSIALILLLTCPIATGVFRGEIATQIEYIE
ncbi:MAG: hypothetical protein IJN75_00620 [Clostridia bacterium]|nr:hypothetical protein [Clostridia bacterium]